MSQNPPSFEAKPDTAPEENLAPMAMPEAPVLGKEAVPVEDKHEEISDSPPAPAEAPVLTPPPAEINLETPPQPTELTDENKMREMAKTVAFEPVTLEQMAKYSELTNPPDQAV